MINGSAKEKMFPKNGLHFYFIKENQIKTVGQTNYVTHSSIADFLLIHRYFLRIILYKASKRC